MKKPDILSFLKKLAENKYVLAVLLLGLALLLLPGGSGKSDVPAGEGSELSASGIPVDTESERIALLLAEMEGVGDVKLLLSAEGAVVVCRGGDSPQVRLNVTNAVSVYTGLGSDKITVMKMK